MDGTDLAQTPSTVVAFTPICALCKKVRNADDSWSTQLILMKSSPIFFQGMCRHDSGFLMDPTGVSVWKRLHGCIAPPANGRSSQIQKNIVNMTGVMGISEIFGNEKSLGS